jgi:predicted unusual protein kinase regulating ubiquinone biosynthesis (AarF/ABC1/UbiB family)
VKDSALRHGVRITVRSAQLAAAALGSLGGLAAGVVRAGRDRDARLGAVGRAAASLCTSLGATFIKVGQIASTRADLLPEPVIRELARLRDEVPPFPPDEVRRAIEGALGKPVDALFASFAEEPVAAASVAQVHRAVLPNGRVVAVKVRRPDIERRSRSTARSSSRPAARSSASCRRCA